MSYSGKVNILALIGLMVLLSASSCNKVCHQTITFDLPVTISPNHDVYHSGDTIWAEIQISKYQVDRITGKEFDIGYFDFNISLSIEQYFSDNFQGALDYFDYYFDVGQFQKRGNTYPNFDANTEVFVEEEFQLLKIGIIIKQHIGDFGLLFWSSEDVGSGVKHFPDDKCDYVIDIQFVTNNNEQDIEKYLDKYPNMPDYLGVGFTIEKFRKYGYYFFTVE